MQLLRLTQAAEQANLSDGSFVGQAAQMCMALFAKDPGAGDLQASDFEPRFQTGQLTGQVRLSERAQTVLHRYLCDQLLWQVAPDQREITVFAVDMVLKTTVAGRLIDRVLPYRKRVILDNMRRAYGERVSEARLCELARSHYSHLATLFGELVSFRFKRLSERAARVRVEGVPQLTQAFHAGRGILVLTGHFGNFEVATVAGIEHFPEVKGRIHFLRRPIKPKWLSDILTRRFNAAGFGVIGRRGSLETIVNRLEAGDAIVFPFDQYAHKPDGILIPFFGYPAGTYKSMAVLAMATGAPVMPGASWREPDGTHVLRFWPPLEPIVDENVGQEIERNTARYNLELERLVLRHPEQWWWVHRRWKNLR